MNLLQIPDLLKKGAATIKRPKQHEKWKQLSQRYNIHAKGILPKYDEAKENPLFRRHPNESIETNRWRCLTFSEASRSAWQKGIDLLHKIFGDSGSQVKWPKVLNGIMSGTGFMGQNFELFIQQTVVPFMLRDPNGLLLWVPTGVGIVDGSAPLEVMPMLVSSDKIMYLSAGGVLVETHETNLYGDTGTTRQEGKVYFWMDTIQCAFIQQVGPNDWQTLYVYSYEAHDLPLAPWMSLGGSFEPDERVLYSFFDAFVPAANRALMQISDDEALTKLFAYPVRVENPIECPSCNGHRKDETGADCTTCKGSGVLNYATDPLKVHVREKLKPNVGQGFNTADDVSFYAPDPAILSASLERTKYVTELMENAMTLVLTQSVQSGVAKAIDREPQYSLLARIADCVYNHLIRNSIEIIYAFYEPDAAKRTEPIQVSAPTAFQITTITDIVETIAKLQSAKAPDGIMREYTRSWAEQYYGGNELGKRTMLLLVDYDPFFTNSQQLLEWRAAGLATDMDVARHKWGERELHKMDSEFVMTSKDQVIFDALDKVIADIVAKEQPQIIPAVGNDPQPDPEDPEDTEDPNDVEDDAGR
jgi:hypothetical protein